MREILFRGKKIRSGEWIEGYYFARPILERHFILTGEEQWEIEPKTLCQYTGLTDKNGNKIWENDVIKHYNKVEIGEPDKYMIASIRWEHNNVRFVQDTEEGKYSIIGSRYFEVIGNIFDGEFQNDSEGTKKD